MQSEKQNPESLIKEMTQRLVENFQPIQIILFGSYARGNPTTDSDVDLLVVMDIHDRFRRRQITAEMYVRLAGIGISKDIIVVTPEYLSAYRNVQGTIIRPACEEGKVLYDRAA